MVLSYAPNPNSNKQIQYFTLHVVEFKTYILLQRCTPHCYKSGNETFRVYTHVSNSANTNAQKNNTYAQFCVSWISNLVQSNFQQAGYRDHTQFGNLQLVNKKTNLTSEGINGPIAKIQPYSLDRIQLSSTLDWHSFQL